MTIAGRAYSVAISAGWTVIDDQTDQPAAEIFATSYRVVDEETAGGTARPLTFLFNGGPGAASAFLHLGAVGPMRVAFRDDGTPDAPPARLVANDESWLDRTDLVFVDPVGTGFSRAVPKEKGASDSTGADTAAGNELPGSEFFAVERDLESLAGFMRRYLSANGDWHRPIYLAGESYGGYRVGRLARMVQESYGIGLNGAILVSPALEFQLLDPGDYDVLAWVDAFPGMASAAAIHGKARPAATPEEALTRGEAFALEQLGPALIRGALGGAPRDRVWRRAAGLLGLDPTYVERAEGRVSPRGFARQLLRAEGKVIGLYDAAVTADDPFPDRPTSEGPDPTLASIDRVYGAGINAWLRSHLGVRTERDYHLLRRDVNRAWKLDMERHVLQSRVGATDDLRAAMSLNPDMGVIIVHGQHDLVTPYFASKRIIANTKRPLRDRIAFTAYRGGHMFYGLEASRVAFANDIRAFIDATSSGR